MFLTLAGSFRGNWRRKTFRRCHTSGAVGRGMSRVGGTGATLSLLAGKRDDHPRRPDGQVFGGVFAIDSGHREGAAGASRYSRVQDRQFFAGCHGETNGQRGGRGCSSGFWSSGGSWN